MKVKVTTRDRSGKELNKGGSVVRGILNCRSQGRVECSASDNSDGTYLVLICYTSTIRQTPALHHCSVKIPNRGKMQDLPSCIFPLFGIFTCDAALLEKTCFA